MAQDLWVLGKHPHATKFYRILSDKSKEKENWTPNQSTKPPTQLLTNANIELFLAKCWTDGSKANLLQGKKWVNHALTHNGLPPLNRHHRQHYASVLDLLAGIAKEKESRELYNSSDGAIMCLREPRLWTWTRCSHC